MPIETPGTLTNPLPSEMTSLQAPLRSQPSTANPTTNNPAKIRWRQLSGEAKIRWPKVNDAELLAVEGRPHKLTPLVQRHYALAYAAAEQQVREFFARHQQRMAWETELQPDPDAPVSI